MYRQNPRIPIACSPGFQGRYTVRPGDTMYIIAQIFRVRLEALVVNNPHITNPNLIFPGDVLCVPSLVPFPCCIRLRERVAVPLGTSGAALIHTSFTGTQSVSVVATLPSPSNFGNFDVYLATLLIPEISGGFGNQLFPTPEDPPTYSTTIDIPTVAQITPNSRVIIEPFRTEIGRTGPVILEGSVLQCL